MRARESLKERGHGHAARGPAQDPAGCRIVRGPGRRRSPSPAAAIRCCRRRSGSARPAPRRSRRPGSRAADLWELRTGRRQQVAVDLRQATASLRSGHYMKMDEGEVSHERNAGDGLYPAKDGRWSYLHANFPNHRAAALSVLGVAEDATAVRGGGGQLGRARSRGGDHRRQGRRRHGAHAWRNGPSIRRPPRSPRCRCWRSSRSATPAGAAARRRPAAVRHPRARPHARARRPDLRPHPGRAWRRRAEDHRARICPISATRNSTPGTASCRRISICASRTSSRRCAGWCARPTCSRRATGRARWAAAACRPRSWRRCGPASSTSRCARSAMSGRGPRAAASTPWCRPSAASPPARAKSFRARARARNSIPVSAIDY